MKKILQTIILVTVVGAVPAAAFGIELKIADRTDNKWGLQADRNNDDDTEIAFNRKDCLDNVGLVLEWVGLDAADGSEAALYIGSGCDDDPSVDDANCKVYKFLSPGGKNNTFPLARLFSFKDDGCSTTESVEVKLVRGDDVRSANVPITKSNIVTVTFDGVPPDAPTLSKTAPGNEKVEVHWDTGTADADGGTSSSTLDPDIKEIIVLWSDGTVTGASDTGTESDTGTDTSEIGTDRDTASELGDAGQSSLDAGADLLSRVIPFQTASDSEEDTSVDSAGDAPSDVCPSDILTAGDAYQKNDFIKQGAKLSPGAGQATIGNLTNNQAYVFAIVGLDEHRNPSLLSNTRCETPGETFGFSKILGESGGKGGKFCFIATQAFGSYDHPVVKILRTFRDEFLEPLPGGKSLIATYYALGPDAARAISKSPSLMKATRAGLTLFAYATVPLSAMGPFGVLIFSLFAAIGITLFRQRRRR